MGGGFLLFASLVATLNTCPLAALTKLTPSPSSPTAQPTTPRLVSFRLSWSLFLDTGALGFEGQFCYQLPAGLDGAGLGRLTGGQSRVATQHQVRKKAENVIFLPSPVSSTSTLCMCRDTSQSRAICWCSLSTPLSAVPGGARTAEYSQLSTWTPPSCDPHCSNLAICSCSCLLVT